MRPKGFTIVELLIVIVVIAILAAIVTAAYNGVQQKARDSVRSTDIANVQRAIEMYYADNAVYPQIAGGVDNTGYALSSLSSILVPQYIRAIPSDPNTKLTNYQYVRGTGGNAYGIRISYEAQTPCHKGMYNTGLTWWGLQACP